MQSSRGDAPTTEYIDVPEYGPHICPNCLGYGYVRQALPLGHPDYGKLSKCDDPGCPVIRRQAIERAETLREQHEAYFDERSSVYTFENWDRLSDQERAGKGLAYLFARHYSQIGCKTFWATDALHAAGVSYRPSKQAVRPNLALPDTRESSIEIELDNGHKVVQPNSCGDWLVFAGEYGTGKTGLAMSIANAAIAAGKFVVYVRLPDLLRDIQSTYSYGYNDRDLAQQRIVQLTAPLADADLLIVDEFNVQADRQGVASEDRRGLVTDYIIEPRYAAHKPLVMTTNLAYKMTNAERLQAVRNGEPVDFESHWVGRIASRVRERAHWLTLGGPSMRHENLPSAAI